MKSLLLSLLFLTSLLLPPDFLAEQKKFERVRLAFEEKGQTVRDKLNSVNIKPEQLNILLVAVKAEKQLELYAKNTSESSYRRIHTFAICSFSGELGPKQQQGDLQVPEGFYYIDRFHPQSRFHLSLGINYPNLSDRRRSSAKNLGGDIFLHGGCLSAGCLAMTDEKIKELYLYAVHARQSGQEKIPVYFFPFRMTNEKMKAYKDRHHKNTDLIKFWENLKTGYDKFAQEKRELQVTTDTKGNYVF